MTNRSSRFGSQLTRWTVLGLSMMVIGCPDPEPSAEEDVLLFGTPGTFEVAPV